MYSLDVIERLSNDATRYGHGLQTICAACELDPIILQPPHLKCAYPFPMMDIITTRNSHASYGSMLLFLPETKLVVDERWLGPLNRIAYAFSGPTLPTSHCSSSQSSKDDQVRR